METTFYKIDNRTFYLDLEAAFKIISTTPNNEKMVNTTITQVYGSDEEGDDLDGGKEIVEQKSSLNDTMNNVRYDLIKTLLISLLSNSINSEGAPVSVMRMTDLSFGQIICLNTLINHKILVEVQ